MLLYSLDNLILILIPRVYGEVFRAISCDKEHIVEVFVTFVLVSRFKCEMVKIIQLVAYLQLCQYMCFQIVKMFLTGESEYDVE